MIITPATSHGIINEVGGIIFSVILGIGVAFWLAITINEWIERWKEND